jgi:putative peptidoglycan lipid II flippase
MSLARAIAVVGGFTMISRVTGFVRDVLIAATLGAGPIADAFFVAFKLPNFFRRLTGEGAMTVAFVPLYAGKLEEDKAAATAFAGRIQAVLVSGLLAFLVVVEIFMPWVMLALAPGFAGDPERFGIAVELTRITFPYLPLISLVALWGGMLNSLGRFGPMAAAPILLNVILIGMMVGLGGYFETPGHLLAWGVSVAGLAQAVMVGWALFRSRDLPRPTVPRLTPEVKRFFKLALPAALGAGVVQVNLLIDIVLASLLPEGSISFLYYADRVVQLPLGVVGVAIGTAMLPLLSRQVRAAELGDGDQAQALDTQNRALEIALMLTIPAAFGIAVLAGPMTAVLFERGAFTAADSQATALAMAAFAIGLPAFVMIKVFQPGFFARRDTATPVKVAVLAVAVNLVLNLVLMRVYAHVGIALATALSSWLNAAILATILWRRGHLRPDARLFGRGLRIVGAALVMAGAVWFAADRLAPWFAGGTVLQIGALVLSIGLGIAVYGGLGVAIGAIRPRELASSLRRRGPDPSPDA